MVRALVTGFTSFDANRHTSSMPTYIHFRRGKVARTITRTRKDGFFAIDLDTKGRVLGIEIIRFQ